MLDPGHPELRVGALVWVQIGGQLISPKPIAIEKIHEREGEKWFFVEGSATGLTADNLTLAATGAVNTAIPTAPATSVRCILMPAAMTPLDWWDGEITAASSSRGTTVRSSAR